MAATYTIQNSGTLSVSAGASSANIPVIIWDDGTAENTESVILTLTGGAGYTVGSPSVHTLAITDNDGTPPPQPAASFALASSSAAENSGTRSVAVNLSLAAPSGGLTVGYSVSGTATAGSGNDYTVQNSGTLSVSAGATTANIRVAINDDSAQESDETVILTLTDRIGYTLGSITVHTLTITDNDDPTLPEASFARRSADALENVGTHNVTINLSPAPSSSLTIQYGVRGSATSADYSITSSGMVTAAGGATSVDIPIRITNDSDNEADERIILTLSSGAGYRVGDQNEFWLTILDDDNTSGTPVMTVCYYRDESSCDSSDYNRDVYEGGQLYVGVNIHGAPLADGVKVKIQYIGGTAQPEDFTINDERPVKDKVYDAYEAYGHYRLGTRWKVDGKREGSETAIFRLVNGAGYAIEGPTDYTVTIKDRN